MDSFEDVLAHRSCVDSLVDVLAYLELCWLIGVVYCGDSFVDVLAYLELCRLLQRCLRSFGGVLPHSEMF